MKLKLLFISLLFFNFILTQDDQVTSVINFKKNLQEGECKKKGGYCESSHESSIYCCHGLICKTLESKFGTEKKFYVCWEES